MSWHGAHSWPILPKSCFLQAAVLVKGESKSPLRGTHRPRDTVSWGNGAEGLPSGHCFCLLLQWFGFGFLPRGELEAGACCWRRTASPSRRSQRMRRSLPSKGRFPCGFSVFGCWQLPVRLEGALEHLHNYGCPKYNHCFLYTLGNYVFSSRRLKQYGNFWSGAREQEQDVCVAFFLKEQSHEGATHGPDRKEKFKFRTTY